MPTSRLERKRSWRERHRGNPCRHRPPGPTMSIVRSTSRESTLLSRLGSKGAVPSRGREAHSEHTRTFRHVAREGLSIVTSSSRHPRTPPPPTKPPNKLVGLLLVAVKLLEKNATKDAVKLLQEAARPARPPPPLSQGDAFKKGTTPERRRRPKYLAFHPRQASWGGRGEQTSKSPSGRSRTPAAPSTSWPPSAARGFPRSLPTLAPPTSHRRRLRHSRTEGYVVSCAAAIFRSGRRSGDPRTLHTCRHLTALVAEGTSCSTQRTPPAARSMPLPPKATALDPRPCHGRGGKPPAQRRRGRVGGEDMEGGRREASNGGAQLPTRQLSS
jgi:hypothetical protein